MTPMQALLSAFLAAIAVGGFGYVFAYPLLSGERKAEKRQAAYTAATATRKVSDKNVEIFGAAQAGCRQLKGNRAQKCTQAREPRRQDLARGSAHFKTGILHLFWNFGAGVRRLVLCFEPPDLSCWRRRCCRRLRITSLVPRISNQTAFEKIRQSLPESIDIIVRGVKAGLPLGDCLRIIATEVDEPVRGEFRQVVEAASMGLSISEACERLATQVPISETSFFAIVINIQQKAGGNLSEALSNLSGVLRARKMMEGKIKAFSSEAKASAMIIASLPFIVAGLVYITSPAYISLLWEKPSGQLVLAGSAIWMAIGVFIMNKMISFDY